MKRGDISETVQDRDAITDVIATDHQLKVMYGPSNDAIVVFGEFKGYFAYCKLSECIIIIVYYATNAAHEIHTVTMSKNRNKSIPYIT